MKILRRRLAIGSLIGVALLVVFGLMWRGTPSYSLVRIYLAVSLRDEGAFRARVNVPEVAKGLARDFVEDQVSKFGVSQVNDDFTAKVLIPFREAIEEKTAQAIDEFVADYFQKDSHGYGSLIRGLPFVALKSSWSRNPEFHLLEFPTLLPDHDLATLKLRLVWWESPKTVVAKIERQSGQWVLTRVFIKEGATSSEGP